MPFGQRPAIGDVLSPLLALLLFEPREKVQHRPHEIARLGLCTLLANSNSIEV
jgi:hypothetical protein